MIRYSISGTARHQNPLRRQLLRPMRNPASSSHLRRKRSSPLGHQMRDAERGAFKSCAAVLSLGPPEVHRPRGQFPTVLRIGEMQIRKMFEVFYRDDRYASFSIKLPAPSPRLERFLLISLVCFCRIELETFSGPPRCGATPFCVGIRNLAALLSSVYFSAQLPIMHLCLMG